MCRFYPNLHWYVDVMLSLIERAGEFATRDIWHATLQLITNDEGLHEYAARKVRLCGSLVAMQAASWLALLSVLLALLHQTEVQKVYLLSQQAQSYRDHTVCNKEVCSAGMHLCTCPCR